MSYAWDDEWRNPPQYGGYRPTAPEPDPVGWGNQPTAYQSQPAQAVNYTPSYTPRDMPAAAPSYTPQQAIKDVAPLAAGAATLNPIGLGIGVAGTALNAYGAYEQGKQADKDFKLQEDQFKFDKALSLEDRQRAEEERRRRAELEAGNYAGGFLDNSIRGYGGYNAMRG